MSSDILGGASDVLNGTLGGAWDAKHGYAGKEQAFEGNNVVARSSPDGAWSLNNLNGSNQAVCRVRREVTNASGATTGNDDEADFTASEVRHGAVKEFCTTGVDFDTLVTGNFVSAGSVSSFTADGNRGYTGLDDGANNSLFGIQLATPISSGTVAYVAFYSNKSLNSAISLRQSTVDGSIAQSSATDIVQGFNIIGLTANATAAFISFRGNPGNEYIISDFAYSGQIFYNGLITTLYDQSGNGNNAVQTVSGSQLHIYSNTHNLFTNKSNVPHYTNRSTSAHLIVENFQPFGSSNSGVGAGIDDFSVVQSLSGMISGDGDYSSNQTSFVMGSGDIGFFGGRVDIQTDELIRSSFGNQGTAIVASSDNFPKNPLSNQQAIYGVFRKKNTGTRQITIGPENGLTSTDNASNSGNQTGPDINAAGNRIILMAGAFFGSINVNTINFMMCDTLYYGRDIRDDGIVNILAQVNKLG
jgi:hypothetical protein